MWYKNKWILLSYVVILLGIINCSPKELEYKGVTIIGYWKIDETVHIYTNDELTTEYFTEGYVRFFDNFCGELFDPFNKWTNDIKWVLQESKDKDVILISVALTASGEASEFYLYNHHLFQVSMVHPSL